MKRNHIMRTSAIVLALVLATACLVSGTFAKYVTTVSTDDGARVAKWGVEFSISNSQMFTNEYDTDDATYAGAVSVKSIDDARVVAPGTKSEDNDIAPIKFSIKGQPEVAVDLDVLVNELTTKDIFLAKDVVYTDYTELFEDDATGTFAYKTFTLDADYHPLKWTLTQTKGYDGNTISEKLVDGKSLAELIAFLKAYSNDAAASKYAPNTILDSTFQIDWEWAFGQNDKADTFLGNLAAGVATTDAANYNLDLVFDITATATQID